MSCPNLDKPLRCYWTMFNCVVNKESQGGTKWFPRSVLNVCFSVSSLLNLPLPYDQWQYALIWNRIILLFTSRFKQSKYRLLFIWTILLLSPVQWQSWTNNRIGDQIRKGISWVPSRKKSWLYEVKIRLLVATGYLNIRTTHFVCVCV